VLHFEPYEVVGQQEAPQLLADGVGGAAPNRLETLKHIGLELAEAKLKIVVK
jgi:type III secretion system FlhB-like substrate exporter